MVTKYITNLRVSKYLRELIETIRPPPAEFSFLYIRIKLKIFNCKNLITLMYLKNYM